MNEQLPAKVDPPVYTFAVAFVFCLAAVCVLHLLDSLLLSTPTSYSIGLPKWFWVRHGDYTRFRASSFVLDLLIALFFSYRIARWYWLYRWRQLNAPK